MAEQSNESEGVGAPLVFQCAKCRVILADSFAWVGADPELNTVTLSGG